MNKFKKTLATALACALIFGTESKAFAAEANKTPSLFEHLAKKRPKAQKKTKKKLQKNLTKVTQPTKKNSRLATTFTIRF